MGAVQPRHRARDPCRARPAADPETRTRNPPMGEHARAARGERGENQAHQRCSFCVCTCKRTCRRTREGDARTEQAPGGGGEPRGGSNEARPGTRPVADARGDVRTGHGVSLHLLLRSPGPEPGPKAETGPGARRAPRRPNPGCPCRPGRGRSPRPPATRRTRDGPRGPRAGAGRRPPRDAHTAPAPARDARDPPRAKRGRCATAPTGFEESYRAISTL